jgi:hypothetical protein
MYPIYYHIWRNISTIFIYITSLASNEIVSPSNKIQREAGRAKDLSAPRYSTMTVNVQMLQILALDIRSELQSGHIALIPTRNEAGRVARYSPDLNKNPTLLAV